jgi:Tol biopolymer transport system component
MAGRRQRRHRRLLIAGGAAGTAGIVLGVWLLFFRGGEESKVATKPKPPPCQTARLRGHLGKIAWIKDHRLNLFDLDTCTRATLVRHGATRPVRFSADGKWVAYGQGSVVRVAGGRPQRILGRLTSWSWSRSAAGHVLVGIDASGDAFARPPASRPPGALVARHVEGAVPSNTGEYVAVALADRVMAVPTGGSNARTLFVASGSDAPEVVGWSPDDDWVLFYVHHAGQASGSLNAAPVGGGGYHNLFDPVLPYADFLTWCGDTLVFSGGGEQMPSLGQQLLTSAPPAWSTSNLSQDFRSSWIWPACSPSGEWIAATITPNHAEEPPGRGRRSVWLVSIDGRTRRRIAGSPGGAFEAPRWSAHGKFVMLVQRPRNDPKAPGQVIVVQIDTKTGTVTKTTDPIANLPPALGTGGHLDWNDAFDWFRPG